MLWKGSATRGASTAGVRRAKVTLLLAGFGVLGPVAAPLVMPVIARAANVCVPNNAGFLSGGDPNDPNYNPAERNPTGSATWNDEQWYLYGCMPSGAPLSQAPDNAAGMSVDKAWSTYSRGRDDIIVSYMEGGVNWRIGTSCELKDRAFLNKGELPLPENADGKTRVDLGLPGDPWDMNQDGIQKGVFNVEDYINDPRVKQALVGVQKSPAGGPYLHHVCDNSLTHIPVDHGGTDITPEDLIVAFGHCQVDKNTHLIVGAFPCDQTKHFDNDGNGYANDINGWNFNRDTNDPQTEQSIYHHFDGESAQLVGEADNKWEGAGMCPLCRYIPIKAGDEAIDRPDRIAEAIVYAADNGVKVGDFTTAALGLTPEVKAAIEYAWHKGMVMTWASNDFESADHTDGMFYPHVWPGNSITADHATRGVNLNCTSLPGNPVSCPAWYASNSTFTSRASLTSYGPHALFSVPNNDGSTSTGIPTQAGVAALVASEGLNAVDAGVLGSQLNADEIKQVVRATSSYIASPGPLCLTCFQGVSGATFNIQYGYGRPNVFAADAAVAQGHIPPTAAITSPDWYQEVDPTSQKGSTLSVSAEVAAPRAQSGAYTYDFQYGLGPEPTESQFVSFGHGSGTGPNTVSANLDLSKIPASFWSGQYTVDPATRASIERYDVTVRVQVHALDGNGKPQMGEDRRAFHLRHDSSERPGFPVRIGSSGESSPTMADIEGRDWLDTIVATADGTVHAFRPDGQEAPGFPVHTGLAPGMDPGYDANYLGAPGWKSGLPRPRDGGLSTTAVGDLRHDGGLEIVMSTFSGKTYVWDGAGSLLPGFPVLNGSPSLYHMSVPPPDTPYSFEPENITGGAPVLADLTGTGKLDIVQAAGDNHIYAWAVGDPGGPNPVSQVPGWPVCDIILPVPTDGTCVEPPQTGSVVHTHDSKIVPTPAIVDIKGNGQKDVVVGLVDTTWDNGTPLGSNKITSYLEAFDPRGTRVSPSGELPGWPAAVPGLIQGYGVAQDFVTQGVESPAVYDSSSGPQAIVNSNLFLPTKVDLRTASAGAVPFAGAVLPPIASSNLSPAGALVQFTTSPSLGNLLGLSTPQAVQAGSAAAEVATGITQTPGLGIRVDNAISAWDTATGIALPQLTNYIQGLAFFGAPAIADVIGDGRPDIIQTADSGAVMGFDGSTGQVAAGFPKWSGGFSLWTPAVGDIAAQGTVDVAAVTREGYLHVWETPGLSSANKEAWHWHQDDWNDGHYGQDTRPPAGIADLTVTTSEAADVLKFTAPGDNWNEGKAARYEVRRSNKPITQDDFAAATPVPVGQSPGVAGSHESLTVPHVDGADNYAVRAVDAAGNIGPVRVGTAAAHIKVHAEAVRAASLPFTSSLRRDDGAAMGLAGALLICLVVPLARLVTRRP
ncbi:MAG TPA: hypothetical protein VNV65_12920 [Candidatus Solibacter sp.]|nr:hypothetical protein [Candidatus Solibacter sp.]